MRVIKGTAKVVAAAILSVVILSIIMSFYSLQPVHIENEKGNTDYVWPANSVWIKASEGISWGKFDENGFNNIENVDNPDIIVLGSSHMEACDVLQNQSTAYLLGEKLKNKYTVYNMGISGHQFYKICQYLPANLELFDYTPKVVILETILVNLQTEKVDEVLAGTVEHTPSHSTGLVAALQRIPFLRALYRQVDLGLLEMFWPTVNDAVYDNKEELAEHEEIVDENAYEELFKYLFEIEEKYKTQIIIAYHHTGSINEDGTIGFTSGEKLEMFEKYANKYNIDFVDMTPHLEDMYYKEHHVAHGFVTGKLEAGHMNKFGHAALASALYDKIISLEEDGIICQ